MQINLGITTTVIVLSSVCPFTFFIARQQNDARYRYSNSVHLSVRLSVRLSVTLRYSMETD